MLLPAAAGGWLWLVDVLLNALACLGLGQKENRIGILSKQEFLRQTLISSAGAGLSLAGWCANIQRSMALLERSRGRVG